jgi:hypothetical protein
VPPIVRAAQFVASGKHRDPKPAPDGNLVDAGRREGSNVARVDEGAGLYQKVAIRDVLAASANIKAGGSWSGGEDFIALHVTHFMHHHAGNAGRHGSAGGQSDGFTGTQGQPGATARCNLGDDTISRTAAWRAQSVSIHRGMIEARQRLRRMGICCGNSARGAEQG